MGIQKCFAEDAGTKRRISYGKQETGGVGLSAADHIFRNLHWLWYCVFGYGSGKSFWLFPTPCSVACGNCVCPYSGTGVKISEKVDVLTENMGRSGVMMIVLIYLMPADFRAQQQLLAARLLLLTCVYTIFRSNFWFLAYL